MENQESNKLSTQSQTRKQIISKYLTEAFVLFPPQYQDAEVLNGKMILFDRYLPDYPLQKLSAAFETYFLSGTRFPVPSDIVNIIEPPRNRMASPAGG